MTMDVDELIRIIQSEYETNQEEEDILSNATALLLIAQAIAHNAKAINLASWRLGTADAVAIDSPSGSKGGLEYVGDCLRKAGEEIATAIHAVEEKL